LDRVGDDTSSRLRRFADRLGVDLELIDAAEIGFGEPAGFRRDSPISKATYLRLFADRVVPDSADRVLYLDSDLLVRRDLSTLYEIGLEGRAVAAARDQIINTRSHNRSGTSVRDDHCYFNAGVLVINLDRMRGGLGERLRDHALHLSEAPWFDQDVLNDLLTEGDWVEFGPEWNLQSPLHVDAEPPNAWTSEIRELRAGAADAAVIHFSGSVKPWDGGWSPFPRQWRQTLRASGWQTPRERMRWETTLLRSRLRPRTRLRALTRRRNSA